jgi:hypothetical protein
LSVVKKAVEPSLEAAPKYITAALVAGAISIKPNTAAITRIPAAGLRRDALGRN